jgi:hypothetical protein
VHTDRQTEFWKAWHHKFCDTTYCRREETHSYILQHNNPANYGICLTVWWDYTHTGSKSLGSTLMAKRNYQAELARVLKHFILKWSLHALCVSWYCFKSDFTLNVLPHTLHACGCWPVCVSWWLFMSDILVNVFAQKGTVNKLVLLQISLQSHCLITHIKGKFTLVTMYTLVIV